LRIPFICIAIGFVVVMFLPAWYFGFLGALTIESLIGAFLGTVAGAILVYQFQLRMEQTRFFQLVLGEINTIFSSLTAWRKNGDTWRVCEFREVVGLAKWTTDLAEVQSSQYNDHEKKINREKIEWKGVLYLVDENYCVASKALHEYANWYGLLLNGLENNLLSALHIKMLWRSIVDNFYERITNEGRDGMKMWSEGFIFGDPSQIDNHPGSKSHQIVLSLLRNYEPVRRHCEGRGGHI